jgi:hypothetical protein
MESLILKRVGELIEKSQLSQKDKSNFVSLLSRATDEELENIVSLFSESSSWVEVMYDNYKNKEAALENKDSDQWNTIVAGEKSMLQVL